MPVRNARLDILISQAHALLDQAIREQITDYRDGKHRGRRHFATAVLFPVKCFCSKGGRFGASNAMGRRARYAKCAEAWASSAGGSCGVGFPGDARRLLTISNGLARTVAPDRGMRVNICGGCEPSAESVRQNQ